MMRGFPSRAGLALAVFALVAAAPAAADPPAEAAWLVCYARDGGSNQKWVSGIRLVSAEQARDSEHSNWFDYVAAQFSPAGPLSGGCNVEASEEDAGWRRAVFIDPGPARLTKIVEVADWSPDFTSAARTPTPILDAPSTMEADVRIDGVPIIIPASAPIERVVADAPRPQVANTQAPPRSAAPVAELSESEADFQRRLAEYEQRLAEQQRQVEAYRRASAELARTKVEQRLAAERAASEYAARMQAHQETLRRHQLEVARYSAEVEGAKGGARHASTTAAATRVK